MTGNSGGSSRALAITPGESSTDAAHSACALLYAFGSHPIDGFNPSALIQARDGNFYGTTSSDNASGDDAFPHGVVFKVTPAGKETVLHVFNGSDPGGAFVKSRDGHLHFVRTPNDGSNPVDGLVESSDGNFYGTTARGGEYDQGTVFRITSTGVETVLYSFGSHPLDGGSPNASLIQARDGNFYGTTENGGAIGQGTVFTITQAGVETILYSFGGANGDGYKPEASVIQAREGDFYGTTLLGGTHDKGTVFKITPMGKEVVLHSFGVTSDDGDGPIAGLVQTKNGDLYGTTKDGGRYEKGTVFRITPEGVETVLHSFGADRNDGTFPFNGLIQGHDGYFYGTTESGGAANTGTVFRIAQTGAETVLDSFSRAYGSYPSAGLIQATDGDFYGTADATFNSNGDGTVFRCVLR